MVKIILAGCLGILVGWAATSYEWHGRCLIQNVTFEDSIVLARDGNTGCAIHQNILNSGTVKF